MKILLIGANGQLGRCLQDRMPAEIQLRATTASQLDIRSESAIESVVTEFKPQIIINAAAYTAVDKAESEPEQAIAVNAHGPALLARYARQVGAKFIHISTDYVFDGTGKTPYLECDPVHPIGVYGRTKLAGELLVQALLPDAIIIRTAWVFSEYGQNFVKTMLRLASQRTELNVVNDQRGCPTYAGDLASAILALIDNQAPGGIYHYCGDKEVSWAQFAQQIFCCAAKQPFLSTPPKVQGIRSEQYPTPAKRPAYSVMSSQRIQAYYPPSDWQQALEHVIARLPEMAS